MNTNTGQIKPLEVLTEEERSSGLWVPVSARVAGMMSDAQEAERERLAAEVDAAKQALVDEMNRAHRWRQGRE